MLISFFSCSYSTDIEVTFQGNSAGKKGFKLEYNSASCDRNYTAEQGQIVHESIENCWVTITAPKNHTISLYFNRFMLYDPSECTKSSLQASVSTLPMQFSFKHLYFTSTLSFRFTKVTSTPSFWQACAARRHRILFSVPETS